jgi:hypothetical protein
MYSRCVLAVGVLKAKNRPGSKPDWFKWNFEYQPSLLIAQLGASVVQIVWRTRSKYSVLGACTFTGSFFLALDINILSESDMSSTISAKLQIN